jgi:hypothetical protein
MGREVREVRGSVIVRQKMAKNITLFISIIMSHGTNNIPWNIFGHSPLQTECGEYSGILSVPHNIVMYLNTVMHYPIVGNNFSMLTIEHRIKHNPPKFCAIRLPSRLGCLFTHTNYLGSKPNAQNLDFIHSSTLQPTRKNSKIKTHVYSYCSNKNSKYCKM